MTSPLCLVDNTLPINGFEASPGSNVTVALQDDAGVNVWELECISTDGYDAPESISIITEPISKTATVAVPNHACGLIFRSTVNGGLNQNGQWDPSYSFEFKIKVLTPNLGLELFGTNETTQGNAEGWGVGNNINLRALDSLELGGASPGGSNGQIQIKNGDEFAGVANLSPGDGYMGYGASPSSVGQIRSSLGVSTGTIIGAKSSTGDASILGFNSNSQIKLGDEDKYNLHVYAFDLNFWGKTSGTKFYGTGSGGAEVARIGTRLFQIANQSNLAILGTTTSPTFGSGVGTVFIGHAHTNPSSNPTNGIITYVDAADGYLKYRHKDGYTVNLNGAGSGGGSFTAAGDLSGSSSSQTVIKINGATVPAAGALTTNHVLKVSGSSATSYGYVTNSNVDTSAAIAGTKISPDFGSQNIVTTGVVSVGTNPAASGQIRLPNNTGLSARNAANTLDFSLVRSDSFNWVYLGQSSATQQGAVIYGGGGPVQLYNTTGHHLTWTWVTDTYVQQHSASFPQRIEIGAVGTNSVTGKLLTIQGQNATGTGTTGGALNLSSGTGTTAHGALKLQVGGNDVLTLASTSQINSKATTWVETGNEKGAITSLLRNVQTTDATVTSLYTFTIPDEAVTTVDVLVTAVTSTGGAGASYKRTITFRRDGGTVTVIGSVRDNMTDENSSAWDCTIDNSTSTGRVRVTGASGTTIQWLGSIRIQSVGP